eukprot:9494459-Pyramimonas_sp.AAC.1
MVCPPQCASAAAAVNAEVASLGAAVDVDVVDCQAFDNLLSVLRVQRLGRVDGVANQGILGSVQLDTDV